MPKVNSKQTVHQKQAEKVVIKPSRRELLRVTEHAPDIICRFSRECRLIYVNPAIEKATGIPTHKFINRTTRELGMPEEHSVQWEKGISYVLTTQEQTTIEFPFPSPTGIRHYHSLLVPEFNEEDTIESILSISRDITEIKELSKQKEEVVGFVSHELKTPLSSLKAFTQLLQQKFSKNGDISTASHLAKMDLQINKLSNIISDLMEATRIDSNTMQINKQQVNFNDLVKEVVEDVQETTKKHKIKIKGKVKNPVMIDKLKVEQVLTNLLSNAVKFSPKSSEITVDITGNDTSITCCVKDKGIGIPKEKHEKIFERFYRANEMGNVIDMGLGLGLYISSEIIRNHKGKIWVESDLGKGSAFYFTLPIK